MRIPNSTLRVLPFVLLTFFLINSGLSSHRARHNSSYEVAYGQTRERTVANTPNSPLEVIKTDVDLITVDALVLQKNNARVVGDLKREDFLISEDGKAQEITHFSQGSLPLSVLFMIDRGGCLDPFNAQVRQAAGDALARLKPTDEVAVMTYHNTADLLQPFTRDRWPISFALDHIPPHDETANHCLNKAFYEAATYMEQAANPSGRRVIVFITGVTRNFDCSDGPGGKTAVHALYESGSVVCGIVPITKEQQMENGMMRWATRVGGLMRASTLNIKQVATDTGGEVLEDQQELLDHTFATLMEHLRSRFSLAFVSTNKLRDGSLRKLKIELKPEVKKTRGELVVKSRKSYVAPRG